MSATKYIFVTGGVLSGLGKGITTASLGKILQAKGFTVSPIKCDAYVNLDAGTMNPVEHGEVFVTNDGIETDQDLGHYERFLHTDLDKSNYTTTGQIYQSVIQRERNLEYDGACVEVVPHVPEELINRIIQAGKKRKADIVIAEIGGTVGEYQNVLFMEAARMMTFRYPKDVIHIHLGYLPVPPSIGEMKSKPVQYSIRSLNSVGIQPDFVVCRSEQPIDERRKQKIATYGNIPIENIIANPDVQSIYEIPLIFEEQNFSQKILQKLNLKSQKAQMKKWEKLVKTIKTVKKEITIGMVGKYFTTGNFHLEDSYVCVIEAIKHAAWHLNLDPKIIWFDADQITTHKNPKLPHLDGLIVPQGWGKRGAEGKINTIRYARENLIPYLGLCYGMQQAVVEFARHVAKLPQAASEEVNPQTPHPVVHIMEYQKELLAQKKYGGTIRLGAYPCHIKPGTKLHQLYQQTTVMERHRHRYEFNNQYRQKLEKAGLIISGTSPDHNLVEAIEIANHPFFIATQFHPELKSRPLDPHPLFVGLIQAAQKKKEEAS